MLGRRKGTPALDEHVSDPQNSSIFTKYPSFLNDKGLVEFLCNSLRPIVDGRCKPAEIGGILTAELQSREAEANRSIKAVAMIADALPGVGIVAAVLGIINTMSNLEDPESVGQKVAAALSGTFLGIFLAYGVGVPITQLITLNQTQEFLYYHIVQRSVSGFATGLSPIMAVEIGRRSLDKLIQPTADELEEKCKEAAKEVDELFPDQVKSKVSRYLVRRKKGGCPRGCLESRLRRFRDRHDVAFSRALDLVSGRGGDHSDHPFLSRSVQGRCSQIHAC